MALYYIFHSTGVSVFCFLVYVIRDIKVFWRQDFMFLKQGPLHILSATAQSNSKGRHIEKTWLTGLVFVGKLSDSRGSSKTRELHSRITNARFSVMQVKWWQADTVSLDLEMQNSCWNSFLARKGAQFIHISSVCLPVLASPNSSYLCVIISLIKPGTMIPEGPVAAPCFSVLGFNCRPYRIY